MAFGGFTLKCDGRCQEIVRPYLSVDPPGTHAFQNGTIGKNRSETFRLARSEILRPTYGSFRYRYFYRVLDFSMNSLTRQHSKYWCPVKSGVVVRATYDSAIIERMATRGVSSFANPCRNLSRRLSIDIASIFRRYAHPQQRLVHAGSRRSRNFNSVSHN